MSIRMQAAASLLVTASLGAASCGGDGVGSDPETHEANAPAPAWSAPYVRGSGDGMAKARASARGAMLVVSASW
jgi:hypothetical protein